MDPVVLPYLQLPSPTLVTRASSEIRRKRQRLANYIRRLNNTPQGLPPTYASKVAKACGMATVMYAADAQ